MSTGHSSCWITHRNCGRADCVVRTRVVVTETLSWVLVPVPPRYLDDEPTRSSFVESNGRLVETCGVER